MIFFLFVVVDDSRVLVNNFFVGLVLEIKSWFWIVGWRGGGYWGSWGGLVGFR